MPMLSFTKTVIRVLAPFCAHPAGTHNKTFARNASAILFLNPMVPCSVSEEDGPAASVPQWPEDHRWVKCG